MSSTTRSHDKAPTEAELFQRSELRLLVNAYASVRDTRGRVRDAAYRHLSVALSRYGQTFVHDGWAWTWSQAEASILRQRMFHLHAPYLDKTGVRKGATPCDR